jgi:hypothetical protein
MVVWALEFFPWSQREVPRGVPWTCPRRRYISLGGQGDAWLQIGEWCRGPAGLVLCLAGLRGPPHVLNYLVAIRGGVGRPPSLQGDLGVHDFLKAAEAQLFEGAVAVAYDAGKKKRGKRDQSQGFHPHGRLARRGRNGRPKGRLEFYE